MSASNTSYGAAAYALVVATLIDLTESGRIDEAERIATTAEKVLDGLVESGSVDKSARQDAQTAIESFRRQVGAVDELR